MQEDDVCLVCADPLKWTAFASCGHKDVCSKCVARLRFVLNDKRCVLCQQDSGAVYFTRYTGDYTTRLSPEEFAGLKVSTLLHQRRQAKAWAQPPCRLAHSCQPADGRDGSDGRLILVLLALA